MVSRFFLCSLYKHVPIDMSIVSIGRLVFNMGRINGDFARLFFRRLVNLIVRQSVTPALGGQDLGNGLRQGRLAVIDVSNSANVHVRLVATERGGSSTILWWLLRGFGYRKSTATNGSNCWINR
jgi:hypothetical protein